MISLHGAAFGGHIDVMKYLIRQGSDVNKNDCRGRAPLHAAVKNDHLEVVNFLLGKGAEGTTFYGLTPLYIATQSDHIGVVNFLVSSEYNVNERNECGKSPLHAACYNGNMDIVKVLVQHNANVNEQDDDGWSPLHAAAQEGHQDIVDFLALNGADKNVKDIDGFTPLHAAVNAGHINAIEGIASCLHDPDEEETGDPRTGGHQNISNRGYVTVTLNNVDTHSRGTLTSQVDNEWEGNDCIQADITKRGAGGLSLQNLSTRTHGAEKDATDPNENEYRYQRRGDPNKEDTGHPLSGGHHSGAKHLATRGCTKKKKVKQIKEVDTKSRTGQLALKVENAEDGDDCIKADNAKRVADKPSLKNLLTRVDDDGKSGREEHNPFSHAKLKYPDIGKQDPMLHQMEAITCPATRTKDTKKKKRHGLVSPAWTSDMATQRI
ncbi:serine/threonine-protein phosphatase 6 regulatory ankyrin repeat subunit B-like [Strongylocentrotus purpuratus]|uniref:Uncharacterized protein n=1 Tax=Strongylocentrotus purpuratus TaxID=7668 RepID=A0A7M7HJ36_STRPU|nr:serine/threonine-protein phosphatase 6 regulatory ankyrin repeat subunit B-like [Strongylocentrotus purpuratus]|eukprot:XP_011681434.1 PREDICTED: serine/threonine-protein phosphatase 6 regulatory ankyrin repeat subunit B-like [Strongylocentrotus purpuratus]